jgi:DNA-binding winged helix-turn-helix (wHTH) protein
MKFNKYEFSVFALNSAAGALQSNDRYVRVPLQTLLLLAALLERQDPS